MIKVFVSLPALVLGGAACFAAPAARAMEYYVSAAGDDSGAGNRPNAAFKTLNHAAAVLQPGDTCWLRAGTYRENVVLKRSGDKNHPIVFAAYRDEPVRCDGSDPLGGPWARRDNGVWETPVAGPVEAIFCDGKMMVEARWPDCPWDDNWDPAKKWAVTDAGSELGRIESAAVARSGQDFSGGVVYLKLSKGNGCYSRRILSHHAGSPTVLWDAAGLPSGPPEREWKEDALPVRIKKFGFAGNRFFLAAPGALNRPQEWWYDPSHGMLRIILPDGGAPQSHLISVRRRVSAFSGQGVSDVTFRGVEFRACNLRFTASRRLRVERCRFIYPATLREFPDETTFKRTYEPLVLQGQDNVFDRCEVSWALDTGLVVDGTGNRVENCVVHDVNLDGRHPGGAITAWGANTVRGCTVYNFGGVGAYIAGQGPAEADHNHLFNGGLYCVDVSAFYIPTGSLMTGTVVAFNWFHDHHGLGFRVDQLGNGITFHHNLAWNTIAGCKLEGTVLAGFHNTVMAENPTAPFMVVFDQGAVHERWRIQNNVAFAFVDRGSLRESSTPRLKPLAEHSGAIDSNAAFQTRSLAAFFVDAPGFDFRPKPGGPLDQRGVAVPGIDAPSAARPSIGALETSGDPWVPGSDWLPGGEPAPRTPAAATKLARSLRPKNLAIDQQTQKYGDL